jgi:protein-S-isoprenylcysteine O-methyltransferase Ste14
VIQSLIFVILWLGLPRPDVMIWQLEGIVYWIFKILQITSLTGLFFTFSQFRVREFLGFSQIFRFYRTKIIEKTDENLDLNTKGIYSISRHPAYLFSILFLGLDPVMTIFDLIFSLWVISYIFFASFFEENRMIRIFGEEYLKYQKNVSKIIPVKWMSNFFLKLYRV